MTWITPPPWLAHGSNLAPTDPIHSAAGGICGGHPTVLRVEPSCSPWPETASSAGLAPSPGSPLPSVHTPPREPEPPPVPQTSLASPVGRGTIATPCPSSQTPHHLWVLAGTQLPLHITALSALAGFTLLLCVLRVPWAPPSEHLFSLFPWLVHHAPPVVA